MKRVGAWLGLGLALGCAGPERGPSFATSARFPEAVRRPPSFAADSLSSNAGPAAPSPTDALSVERAFAIQTAVVPVDSEAARDLVERFFMAVLLESTRDLLPLFGTQAWVVSEGSRQPAQAVWRARFAQLDYTSLVGRVVAAPQTLHTYTFASAERAKRDGAPPPQAEGEVVVVARPGLAWAGKTRLFGEQLAFRLRPRQTDAGYEIAEIIEDFRLP